MDADALLRGARKGDHTALEQLCARCHPRLCRYVYALTRSRETAEDVAQDTLLAMLRALPDFRGHSLEKFDAWLLRIARNRVISEARRRKAVPLPEGFDPPDPAPLPGECVERAERRERILRALDSLDAEMREMVILRYEMELSYAQIAAALEISQTRVKWRLRDAREKLRGMLADESAW